MGAAVAVLGVLIGMVGVVGAASPDAFSPVLDRLKSSPRAIYGLAGIRLLVGMLLVMGASSTALPMVITVLGVAFILRAAVIPLLGPRRVRALIEGVQGRSSLAKRVFFLAVAGGGGFLVWVAV